MKSEDHIAIIVVLLAAAGLVFIATAEPITEETTETANDTIGPAEENINETIGSESEETAVEEPVNKTTKITPAEEPVTKQSTEETAIEENATETNKTTSS